MGEEEIRRVFMVCMWLRNMYVAKDTHNNNSLKKIHTPKKKRAKAKKVF